MRKLYILLLTIVLTALLLQAAEAKQKQLAPKDMWNRQIGWVTVPVFYVTDRHFEATSGEIDFSEHQRLDGLSYGVKNVTIPYTAHLNNYAKQLRKMGWRILSLEGEPHQKYVNAADLRFPDTTLSKIKFLELLDQAIDEADKHELLIHIHGCCVNYKNSLVNAAKLEGWYRQPVILYDWTSPNGLQNYLRNEPAVAASQTRFDQFVFDLEDRFKPQRLAISAHSMGNRLLDNFLVSRFYKWGQNQDHPKLKESIFACADVDINNFAKHTASTAYNSRITRIYISGQDPALLMSELVHGFASRLGRPGGKRESLCKTEGMDVIDDEELYIKHDLPDWLIANMHRYGRAGERNTYDVVEVEPHFYKVKEKKL